MSAVAPTAVMIYGGKKLDILKQLFHTFYLLILLTTAMGCCLIL